jgi:FKBP-type peptidyl-prolyl cis-trans isomerase FklB
MKLNWMTLSALGLLAAPGSAEEALAFKTQKEKVSYGIGVDAARSFQRMGIDLDVDVLIKAMRDVYSGGKLLMTEEDLRATMTAYQADLREKRMSALRQTAADNKKAGDAFLAENKAKQGVVALPSGLQYKVLKQGSGPKPTDTDSVEVHYRGTLVDGTEFDSSYRRGQPGTFKVKGGVIPGWSEALLLMPVGSKWQFFVPPQLAYGERGAGRDIGPNATLVFEVELLAVK